MDYPTMEGETFARRRDRRVSFAETTAVHVFDRDDSLGTPPKSESNVSMSPGSDSGCDESSRDTRDDGDDDDDDDDEEEEEGSAVPPVRFVRTMTDFSPSSASAASVASNDDDNYFGPLSRSFMGSGRPSDSGMSEDNNNEVHDITLDSTAFSLHYRNIGGDDRSVNSPGSLLETPNVDNKTPFVKSGINELSGANGTIGKFKFSDNKSSAGFGDFSFAANNSSKYEYGKMSSTLSDLLRQVDESMKHKSSIPHPVDFQMDQDGVDAMFMEGEVSNPTDASVDQIGDGSRSLTVEEAALPTAAPGYQNGDGAESLSGKYSHPIDVLLDKNGKGDRVLRREVSHPIDVSVDQNGDGADSFTRKDAHPIDVSIDKKDHADKPLIEEVARAIAVSVDQNSHGAETLTEKDVHPNNVSIDQNGDADKPSIEKIAHAITDSVDQNGAEPLTGIDFHPIDASLDKNGDGAEPLMEEVTCPTAVSVDQNGYGVEVQTGKDSHRIDVSLDKKSYCARPVIGEVSHQIGILIDKNDNSAMPPIEEISYPVNFPAYQNDDHAKLLAREDPHLVHYSINEKGNGAKPLTGDVLIKQNVGDAKLLTSKVSLQVDVSMVQNSNVAQPVQNEDIHQIDFSVDNKNNNGGKLVKGLVSHAIDVSMENNVNCNNLQMFDTHTFDDEPANEKDEVPVEKVLCQEFDLEGRKRKLQQFLASIEDRPAKHTKTLGHESQVQQKKHQNYNPDWSKLVEGISKITKVSFSSFVEKLSVQELASLSGMIEKIQPARKYERLSAFMRNHDPADQRHQRLVEARSLHDKLLYEKTKLELNHLKLNKLRSKTESACQRAQECLLLKSRISGVCDSNSKEAYTELDCCATNSVSVTQDVQDRVHAKRQTLKSIEQHVKNLRDSLYVSCNITDGRSCNDVINIVKEHLKLKRTHGIVQRDLNAWKLHDIVKQDKCEVALDYNFLFQRFILGTSKSGSIVMNTTLNNANILQAFGNMNAYSAIEFVLKSKFAVCNIESTKFVRQETLEMSLLLGNVIDVLHEVKTAKRELLNLISTDFNYKLSNPSMLELQLSFMNFKRGKKTVISLDLSDLKFGMYPIEPSGLHIEIDPTMTTFDELFSKEIKALVQKLPTGRLMVLRLCRAVSQYVHSSYMD